MDWGEGGGSVGIWALFVFVFSGVSDQVNKQLPGHLLMISAPPQRLLPYWLLFCCDGCSFLSKLDLEMKIIKSCKVRIQRSHCGNVGQWAPWKNTSLYCKLDHLCFPVLYLLLDVSIAMTIWAKGDTRSRPLWATILISVVRAAHRAMKYRFENL